ncbi:hypothetical protein P0082_04405 [Candidatus Haliotispira prima]|uniref:Uncharacterized protein n=1 Tax=Candidatus Haliotispira prima TaxID=3034016 RepID=A0ABY8MLP6_9SPIO|nr:hypothetical protein P0082_04405 [Candidatus Haliotispira prima]
MKMVVKACSLYHPPKTKFALVGSVGCGDFSPLLIVSGVTSVPPCELKERVKVVADAGWSSEIGAQPDRTEKIQKSKTTGKALKE